MSQRTDKDIEYDMQVLKQLAKESVEAQGLAKHNDEDPFIIRVIAKKCN